MRNVKFLSLGVILIGLAAYTVPAQAHEGHEMGSSMNQPAAVGELVPATAKDAAWVAKAKAEYPTDVCVVSGDKLGEKMGKPVDFIYREEGKPDRLVSFCCKDCIKDFSKNPGKYLKILDKAAKAKTDDMPGMK